MTRKEFLYDWAEQEFPVEEPESALIQIRRAVDTHSYQLLLAIYSSQRLDVLFN